MTTSKCEIWLNLHSLVKTKNK